MTIQVVFFDMGGTIQSYRHTRDLRIKNAPLIQNCLLKGGIHLSLADDILADIITRGMDAYHKWNRESLIELNPTDVWKNWIFKDFSVTEKAISPIAEEMSYLFETKFYIREMRPEIPVVLEEIKGMGLRIGLISNTQSRKQVPNNLQEYGIDRYFDPIVLSSEYGRRKPDPSIFYYAARMANVPTGSCVYIGDKVNRDILGSKRAGFNLAIQIIHQYNNGELDEGATPDAVIQSMNELIPILERALQAGNNKSQRGTVDDYKALFFDAGDILYHRPNSGKNLRKFLKDKPLQPHPDLQKERARLKSMAFEDQICRHDYYKKIIGLYGIVDSDLIQQGVRAMEQDDLTVEIVDGVRDTLLCLKERGYILGIITDTALPIHIKLGWFEKYGFGHIWDTVVSSREIRVRKPSPRIYQEAVQQIGLQPGETVFVGHKTAELMGARKYGMRTVAFNYDKDAPADTYIKQFSDLLNLYPGHAGNHGICQVSGTPVLYDAALSTMWNIKQSIPFPETFEVARRIGFNRFELNHQLPPDLIRQIDFSQNRIGSLHDPCPAMITMDEQKERDWIISSLDEASRNQGVAIVKRTIDQAVSLHARLVVIHPGSIVADSHLDRKLRKLFRERLTASQEYHDIKAALIEDRKTRAQPHLDAVVRSLEEIIEYARPTGLIIGLENRYRYYDIPILDEMAALLDLASEEWFGFQYDVGHAQTLDRLGLCNHESWLKRYASRMVGVHLHDVIGIMDHQKPGSGDVDFNMVASYLSDKVYRTVEVSPQLSVEDISAGMEVLTQFGCVNRL